MRSIDCFEHQNVARCTTGVQCAEKLQYSSQIVETDTFSLKFSGKILKVVLHTVSPPEMCLLPPQC